MTLEGLRVLIAEDETLIRLDLRQMLEEHGMIVCGEARDGLAAVDLARETQPDLAVFDLKMPNLDGVEAARRVYAERPLPIIMLTAYSDRKTVERAIAVDQARRAAEEALARAQWYAGIGETVVAVQHEINNPLAALLGNVALLTAGLASPAEEKQCMAVIAEQAMRIATVVRRLGSLRAPRSVEYVAGSKMLDLSGKDSG